VWFTKSDGLGDESVNFQSKKKTLGAIESWAQPGTFAPGFFFNFEN
jgi:hypothetical protein